LKGRGEERTAVVEQINRLKTALCRTNEVHSFKLRLHHIVVVFPWIRRRVGEISQSSRVLCNAVQSCIAGTKHRPQKAEKSIETRRTNGIHTHEHEGRGINDRNKIRDKRETVVV
jgi:hypothetical protein